MTVDGAPQDIAAYPDSYPFSGIQADHEIAVEFELITFSINTSVVNGTVTPLESGILPGEDRVVSYAPDTGYHLDSVTVDGAPVDIAAYPSSYPFDDIQADHTVDVVFEINTYAIDTEVTGGTITADESGIPFGSDRVVTYDPNTGYHLASVTVDGAPVDIAAYPSSYPFDDIAANHMIEVVFEINTYAIDTEVTGGTITADESGIPYGSDRVVTYDPNAGYHLMSVTVDGAPVDIAVYPGNYPFDDIAANHTISVVYAINTYAIDTTVTNGTITADESGIPYGSDRTITYAANTGYHLKSVTVDGTAQDISSCATCFKFAAIGADHTVTVVFEIDTFTIDTTVTNGTITADESGIPYGSDRTIAYSANAGYTLKSVKVDGVSVDIAAHPSSYTFKDIAANHTIEAVFEDEEIPQTGDYGNIPMYILLMAVALGGIALALTMALKGREKAK